MNKTDQLKKDIIALVKKETDVLNSNDDLQIEEVGDGNVNYIYRVTDKSGKSLIVKFADSFIRGSDTRELSTKRNEIEYEILLRQDGLSNGAVPKVYHYSKDMSCIIMEDMHDYKVLREAMMNGETFDHFAKDIATFLYNTLFKTTDLVMDVAEKKEVAGRLVNIDMCEISERLVFTEPYMNNQGLNKYHADNTDFVLEHLYNNDALKTEVAILKNRFMNNTQSMIHGDLHAGSIFINDKDLQVFDPEFSFYGPMGYDIGNVVGSFIISYVTSYYEGKESSYVNWIYDSVISVVDAFIEVYNANYMEDVNTHMFKTESFKKTYLDGILADIAAYAGTEIIRRTVGVAKVWDLERVQDHKDIAHIEKALVSIGETLILNRATMTSGQAYKEVLERFVKEI